MDTLFFVCRVVLFVFLEEDTLPPIHMELFDVSGGPGLDRFPFEGTGSRTSSFMLIGGRVPSFQQSWKWTFSGVKQQESRLRKPYRQFP